MRRMSDVPSGFVHIPTIMTAERLSEQLARCGSEQRAQGTVRLGEWSV